ncbi:FxLYD domain-containing protein [Clostridium thermarum]|uniref:FxLYD domain-containing protein n=1 Tax=Clostridium thermarum TaxID=1716543 RepID=UPI00111D6BF9|nr:FxLYD domain-containing protein [Clostridium thermarum]
MEKRQKVKANGKVLAWYFGILSVIILLLVYVALSDNKNTSGSFNGNTTVSGQNSKSNFELLGANFKKDGSIRYVVGRIKNTSGKDLSYARVDINLYDRNGNQIDSTFDNVKNLANNAVWSFKALVLDDKAYRYEIVEVTGY